ncbi:L,D-transpeptidase catalytic domain [Prosthecobacter debontii]|uniref:L,D-transpeptidase catalytic domain n=1 Tax=Prosthecobacter debontii TaxID=48467 RepID=A0A1T4Z583_9BACT|nr:L,D-transpeptidase [Prosthecobacter debontii]SKB09164.1 L,D-transpeptidase catalytic domain [Prosthecobacter debontii]
MITSEPLLRPRIEVSVGTQHLALWNGFHQVKSWPCSTSKFGLGYTEGSNKTPLGGFVIREKHGHGAPAGTIFKSREPVGLWTPEIETADDLILSRILWLEGVEKRNANTYKRYIYIHGTNDVRHIGRPASHGCVRLANESVIELFDLVTVGTSVWITE